MTRLVVQANRGLCPNLYLDVFTAAGNGCKLQQGYSPNYNTWKLLLGLPEDTTEDDFVEALEEVNAIYTPVNVQIFGENIQN